MVYKYLKLMGVNTLSRWQAFLPQTRQALERES